MGVNYCLNKTIYIIHTCSVVDYGKAFLSTFTVIHLSIGKHKRLRLFNRPKFDLKKRLKEMMASPSTGPYCLSENRELFQRVMEEFFHYEENVSIEDMPHICMYISCIVLGL